MAWWRREKRDESEPAADGAPDEAVPASGAAARAAAWATLGRVDSDVLAHLIYPAFMGRPRWPAFRQAFVHVQRARTVIIASDGLSDPYDDDAELATGIGLEVFVETSDPSLSGGAGAAGDAPLFRIAGADRTARLGDGGRQCGRAHRGADS